MFGEKQEPFKVGDKVAVMDTGGWGTFNHAPKQVQTVKKVLKPYLELDDNTKWKHNGDSHPYASGYHRRSIEHLTDEHKLLIRRAQLWRAVEYRLDELKKHCEEMTLKQLEGLAKAVESALRPEGEGERGDGP